jgi:cytochrome c nitrite reductase small subunit
MAAGHRGSGWFLLERLSPAWRWPILVALALLVGVGIATARASNATSYLSDDPATCLNCHVMRNAYGTWSHGSHGRVTVCNDCHVPHTNPVAKVAFKGQDGMRHSYVFTLHGEPQALRMNPGAVPVVQGNCLRCHADQFLMIRLAATGERRCWDCHENIHGDVRSLSATPFTQVPELPPAGL